MYVILYKMNTPLGLSPTDSAYGSALTHSEEFDNLRLELLDPNRVTGSISFELKKKNTNLWDSTPTIRPNEVPRPSRNDKEYKSIKTIWNGTFESTYYKSSLLMYGDLEVMLPQPINMEDICTTEGFILYKGIYGKGDLKHMNIEIEHPNIILQGSSTYNPTIILLKTFEPRFITFYANKITENYIEGTYESNNPIDKGVFSLVRTSDTLFTLHNKSGCIVC